MQKLTTTEEQIMHLIWQLGRCTVRDIMERLAQPDVPHSTVSSVVRILEKKGFVGHKAYGKTHEYFPLVSKDAYGKTALSGLVDRYFGGSVSQLVSFLVKKEGLDLKELSDIVQKMNEHE
jgi:BlaI family penicillinase repressor